MKLHSQVEHGHFSNNLYFKIRDKIMNKVRAELDNLKELAICALIRNQIVKKQLFSFTCAILLMFIPLLTVQAQPTVSVPIRSFGGVGDDSFEKVAFVPVSSTTNDIAVAARKGNGCATFLRFSPTLTLLRNIDFACPATASSSILESSFGFDGAGNLGYALSVRGTIRVGTQLVTRPEVYSIVGIVSNTGVVQAVRANTDYTAPTEVVLNRSALYVQYFDDSMGGGGVTVSRLVLLRFNGISYDQVGPAFDGQHNINNEVEGDSSIISLFGFYPNGIDPVSYLSIQRVLRTGRVIYNQDINNLFFSMPNRYQRYNYDKFLATSATNNAYITTMNEFFVIEFDQLTNPLNIKPFNVEAVKVLSEGAKAWSYRVKGDDISLHSAAISETESYFSVFSASKSITMIPSVFTPPLGRRSYFELFVNPTGTVRNIRRLVLSAPISQIKGSSLSIANRRAIIGTLNSGTLAQQGFIAVY